jgi:hypothetical protein
MARGTVFRARLLRRDAPAVDVEIPRVGDQPPGTLRRVGDAADSSAAQVGVEVYTLLDADGWPAEATYLWAETVSRPAANPDV